MSRIDQNKCIGCAVCANICPAGIEMAGNKAQIKNKNAECLKDAADACPQGAIIVDERGSDNKNAIKGFDQGYGQGKGRGVGLGRGRGLGRRMRGRKWQA